MLKIKRVERLNNMQNRKSNYPTEEQALHEIQAAIEAWLEAAKKTGRKNWSNIMSQRNTGEEILQGLQEIKDWRQGKLQQDLRKTHLNRWCCQFVN